MRLKIALTKREFLNRIGKSFEKAGDSKSRYCVLYGGAGSGKSKFAGAKLLFRILSNKTTKPHKFLVARKVKATLRNSCFALLCSYINEWNLSKAFKINKSDLTIEHIQSKSIIIFAGLDDVEKIKSIDGITGIWIEEASELSQNDFQQLDLRLRGTPPDYKQILLSFNPISSTHWLKKFFFEKVNDSNTFTLKTTYKDNHFIDDTYKTILENLKHTNEHFYNVYALGEWGSLEGVIYHYEIVQELPKEIRQTCYGVDFGYNDPTAVIKVSFTDNEIYLEELLYQRMLTTSDIISVLNRDYPYLKKLRGYFEVAEPDRIQEFKRNGYIINEAKKSIIDGINEVKRYKIKVLASSKNIIEELENYTWDKDKEGNPIDLPIDKYNHGLDAVRYAVFTHPRPQAPFSYIGNHYKEDLTWV